MDTFEAIQKRVSIRKYQGKPVPRELIEKIVDSGRRAPTARLVEPWDFIVIQNKETMLKLSKITPNGGFVKDAPCCIAVICQDTKYYLEDGCGATENILLSCADLGLGSCWIAGDKKDYAREIVEMLKCPEGSKLVSLISIGWPAEEKKQFRNRQLKDVIHWEEF
ncbi:MAG: nitroreductase family protein [Candidatus Omnitrophica bacterium]|nr:nitroreductase family protein [Candidatus Omnitrophota bacterium]